METPNDISEKIRNGTYVLLPKRMGRSPVWDLFADVRKSDGTILDGYLCCRKCNRLFKYDGKHTSNLNRHRCFYVGVEDHKPITIEDKKAALEACAQWIIADCRPYSIIEGAGFHKLAKFLVQIGAKYGENIKIDDLIPEAGTISRQLNKTAHMKKVEMKAFLEQRIDNRIEASVTMDMWTDMYVKRNFLCASLHFQKDNRLQNIALGIKSMDLSRTNDELILSKLKNMLGEFGIKDLDKLIFVTESEDLKRKPFRNLTRINCSSELLSNVLELAEDASSELKGIIQNCKKLVKYFKNSNSYHNLPSILRSPGTTRWNSNFVMFKFIAEHWIKITKILADSNQDALLGDINISTIQSLLRLYQDFNTILHKLQDASYPSLCFVLPSINKLKVLCTLDPNDIAAIAEFKQNILSNLNAWTSKLSVYHRVANFLYPPAKEYIEDKQEGAKEFCRKEILERLSLSSHNIKKENSDTETQTMDSHSNDIKEDNTNNWKSRDLNEENSNTSMQSIDSNNPEDKYTDFKFFFSHLIHTPKLSLEDWVNYEIERYSSHIEHYDRYFDVMTWWQQNQTNFPYLSKLAFFILSIPASVAASQGIRNLAGNLIVTGKSNCIAPKAVDSTVFLNLAP